MVGGDSRCASEPWWDRGGDRCDRASRTLRPVRSEWHALHSCRAVSGAFLARERASPVSSELWPAPQDRPVGATSRISAPHTVQSTRWVVLVAVQANPPSVRGCDRWDRMGRWVWQVGPGQRALSCGGKAVGDAGRCACESLELGDAIVAIGWAGQCGRSDQSDVGAAIGKTRWADGCDKSNWGDVL
jgi:hypothetical protein